MRVTDEMVEAFASVYHFRGQTYAPDLVRAALEAALSHAAGQEVEYPEAAEVCAEAYQVVGCLLDDLGIFDTPEAEKILDNLSQHRLVHRDVLPWTTPAVARSEGEG